MAIDSQTFAGRPALRAVAQRMKAQANVADNAIAALDRLTTTRRSLEARETLYNEASDEPDLHIVEYGWFIGFVNLADGTRYIHRIYQAGDIIGLEDTNWSYATSSVEALTSAAVASTPKYEQADLFRSDTLIGAALYGIAMGDQVVMMDTAKANARLKAPARLAHLFLTVEARQRLNRADPTVAEDTFALPLNQTQLADAVGLSLVHTNKALARLRADDHLTAARGTVTLHNRPVVETMTGFTNRYVVANGRWRQALAG